MTPEGRTKLQRSTIVRGTVLLAAIFVAYDAGNRAHQEYLRVAYPRAAIARSPIDMAALQRVINDDAIAGTLRQVSARDAADARMALLASPINSPAFGVIGLHAEQKGDQSRAAAAYTLSEDMSRRNTIVQLRLIEYAVARQDVAQALKHYDAALSVKPDLSDALFPILSAGITEPAIRAALRPYILRHASWTGSLLIYAISHGDPHHVITLLRPLVPQLRGSSFNDVNRALADRLVDYGDVSAAARVVGWSRPKSASTLSSLAVTQETLDPQMGVFAWRLADEEGLSVTQNVEHGFDITARPLAAGVAATRVLPVLEGHKYTFQQTLRTEAATPGAYRWQGVCFAGTAKRQFWDQPIYPADRVQQWVLTVPKGCTGIQFSLRVDGPDGQLSSTVSITGLVFRQI